MTKQERIKRKWNYIQKLYNIAFDGISDELIEICQCDRDLIFIDDDLKELIHIDQEINQYKHRIKDCRNKYENYIDDCRELFHRLSLVHRAIYELMKTEYDIVSCWEKENGRLEYVQC